MLKKKKLPPRSMNEMRFLYNVSAAYPEISYRELTADRLAEIVKEKGIDFATGLLYDRLRRSPEQGAFIKDVEAIEPCLGSLPQLSGKILVAPAAFYQQYPHYNGDGRIIREIAADFGMKSAILPVPSAGAVMENARIIRKALAGEKDQSIVLVSMSKGGADVRMAITDDGARSEADRSAIAQARRKVRAWVQICGLIHGSPVVDMMKSQPWKRAMVYGYLVSRRSSPRLLEDMAYGPGTLLDGPATAPPGVPVLNVLAFPLTVHLTGGARKRHQWMAPMGPNDGSTLLLDALVEPGMIYPVWGADHYFLIPEASRTIYRLFLYFWKSGYLEEINQSIGQ